MKIAPALIAAIIAAIIVAATVAPLPAHAGVGDLVYNVLGGSGGRVMSADHSTPNLKLKVRIVDGIYFTPGEDDVARLDNRAMIQETREGRTRRIEFKNDGNGGVARTYRVNGREQPFDADAKRWVATIIPTVYRELGFDAENRVKRLYAAGGVDAVLVEIDRIESNHSRGKYIAGLAGLEKLNDKRLQRLFDATQKTTGDFDRKNALLAIMHTQTNTATLQTGVLDVAAKMDSDFDRRSVLVDLSPKLLDDANVAAAWRVAMKKIKADFDVRTVIESLGNLPSPSARQLDLAIEATLQLDADFDHAVALKSILKHLKPSTPQVAAWMKSAETLKTDHERREVLTALINQVSLDKITYNNVFNMMAKIVGDSEKLGVLQAAAKRMPHDAELTARYREAARGLGEHERGQAERALERANL